MTKSRQSTQTQPNIVLAVDPGIDRVGIAVLTKVSGKEKLLFSECFITNRKDKHGDRLVGIGDRISEIIEAWKPTTLAIEKLFFNQNVSSAIAVAESRGVATLEACRAGLAVYEYSPQAVKIAVTGYGKAAKLDIQKMVGKLVSLPKREKKILDDELDAIALGITHLATWRSI